jgi:hypothetical protein
MIFKKGLILMEEQGKICTKCGKWKLLEEYNKFKHSKDGRESACRECRKEYYKQYNKQRYEENKEKIKAQQKKYREANKEKKKEYDKRYAKENAEHIKERAKQYYEKNIEHFKKYNQDNAERIKEWGKKYRQDNAEYIKERKKRYYQNTQKNNLQNIANIVEQINPLFREMKLPIYGYVYMFENVKTRHRYLGQTIRPLKERYGSNVIKGWIKERKCYENQKFKEELIEEDFEVTEVFDVAFCKWHLDKLETYWINRYDSCNNGYNIEAGNHSTDDGLEEFEQILKENGLQFINGKLIAI